MLACKASPSRPCVVLLVCLLVVVAAVVVVAGSAPPAEAAFDDNYVAQWGRDGYHLVVRGTEANVTMDQSSGTYVREGSETFAFLSAATKIVRRESDGACVQVPGSGPSVRTAQGSST